MARILKNQKRSEAFPEESPIRSNRWRWGVGGLLFLVICLAGFGVIKVLRGSSQPIAIALATRGPDVVTGIEKQKGPWDELEISDIQIERRKARAGG